MKFEQVMNALVHFNRCLPDLRLYAVFSRWPLLHAANDLPNINTMRANIYIRDFKHPEHEICGITV